MLSNQEIKKITKELSVLHVDDEEMILNLYNIVLKKYFKSAGIAKSGNEALNVFKENNYDIVVTDLEMPGMDGLLLSSKLREINPDLPILVLSAYLNSLLAEKFEKKNIYYLKKPISQNILLEKICEIWQKKK